MVVDARSVLRMQDDARSIIRSDDVDAIRRGRNPRRLFIMMGNTSQVFSYEDPDVALEDFRKVEESMGGDALKLNDLEPTVVDRSAVVGVRDNERKEELLVMLPSWTLLCYFTSLEARLEAYDKLAEALLEDRDD